MRRSAPASAVLLAALLSACSWNPLSWGGASDPCATQSGATVGECATVTPEEDVRNDALARTARTSALSMTSFGERVRFAADPAPPYVAAFNAIGDAAVMAQPRVFEAERDGAATVGTVRAEDEAYLVLPSRPSSTPQRQRAVAVAGVAPARIDPFMGVIVVRRDAERGPVDLPRGAMLRAQLTDGTHRDDVPPLRNFQTGIVSTPSVGTPRMRALLAAGSGAAASSSRRSGDAMARTLSGSELLGRSYEARDPAQRAQAGATRANRMTAALAQDDAAAADGRSSSARSENGVAATDAAQGTSSSSSSRASILDRLRGTSSSAGSRGSILDRLRGSNASADGTTATRDRSGEGERNADAADDGDNGWTARGSFVRGDGGSGDGDAFVPRGSLVSGDGGTEEDGFTPRGSLVSGNGSDEGDDWQSQGTFVRTGGGDDGDEGFTPAQRERCPRNRSLIGALFGDADVSASQPGWTFPVLINGDCPMAVGVMRTNTEGSPFGSMDF